MNKNVNKLFWGLIFIFVNINLGPVDILPQAVGYVMIAVGMNSLDKGNRWFRRGRIVSWILVLFGICDFILGFKFQTNKAVDLPIEFRLYTGIFMCLNIILIYYLCYGMMRFTFDNGDEELKSHFNAIWYFYGVTATIISLCVFFAINYRDAMTGYLFFLPFIQLVIYIRLAVLLRRASKLKLKDESDIKYKLTINPKSGYVLVSMILIISSAILFNMWGYYLYKIDKPYFLKQYTEKNLVGKKENGSVYYSGNTYVDIYYFTNSLKSIKDGECQYREVAFPEINSSMTDNMNYYNPESHFIFGTAEKGIEHYPYKLKHIRVDLGQLTCDDGRSFWDIMDEKDQVTLTTMEAYNGEEKETIDIGKIILSKDETVYIDDYKLVTDLRSLYSNDGNATGFKAREDITVKGIRGSFLDEFSEKAEIKINKESLGDIEFPLHMQKGSMINVEIYKDNNSLELHDSNFFIDIEDKDGNQESLRVWIHYSDYDVITNLDDNKNLNDMIKAN